MSLELPPGFRQASAPQMTIATPINDTQLVALIAAKLYALPYAAVSDAVLTARKILVEAIAQEKTESLAVQLRKRMSSD